MLARLVGHIPEYDIKCGAATLFKVSLSMARRGFDAKASKRRIEI
jgi:hypothetical protein